MFKEVSGNLDVELRNVSQVVPIHTHVHAFVFFRPLTCSHTIINPPPTGLHALKGEHEIKRRTPDKVAGWSESFDE